MVAPTGECIEETPPAKEDGVELEAGEVVALRATTAVRRCELHKTFGV